MGWCGARFLAELDHTRDHHVLHEAASTTPTTAPLAAATLRTATPEATVRTAMVRTALVAAGDTESVRDRLDDRHAVALHTVTEQDGATSVIALRTALATTTSVHAGGAGSPGPTAIATIAPRAPPRPAGICVRRR